MNNTLFASVAFSLCALFYEVFILVMYLNKKKFKNIENSIFILLMILTFGLIFVEIGYIYYLSIYDRVETLAKFMCRVYLNGIIAWLHVFIFYMYALQTKPIKSRTEKDTKRKYFLFLLCIFAFIIVVLSNLLPLNLYYGDSVDLYRFDGPGSNIVYFSAAIAILYMIYIFIIRKKFINVNQRKPMYFAIVFILLLNILQIFIPIIDYNTQNFQFVIILMALFFTLENQDTKLLSEHEESKAEADRANEEQTEFLTSMSHEIRTPMNTIMGFSDALIREGAQNKEVVKNDTINIHTAAVSLLELINNILDLSRIESGKETVVEKEFELQSLIVELNDLVYSKINKDRIKFKIIIDETLPAKITTDYTKYSKILSNVLINVMSYTRDGSIILKIGKKESQNDKFIFNFDVISDGSYINEEDYVKYYKDENQTSNRINNIVLGVNVAKLYAGMLNGKIKFNSVYGKNISYNVTLECQVYESTPIGNINELLTSTIQSHKITLEGKKILVVDDNQMNIKLINRLLGEYKPTIESAINGQECIDKARDTKYDLIFLDHMMPGMDGIQTLAKLKDIVKDLPPVIALTANSYSGIREMYVSNGFDDYLAKPINRNDLNKLLYNLFNNK